MRKRFCRRASASAVCVVFVFGLAGTSAPAALDMVVGAQTVVKGQPLSSCNAKAKDALNTALQNASEVDDTGEWKASGAPDASGNSFAAAAVHCYPLDDNSYVVTFTCAAQVPPNPDTANAICTKVTAAFGSGH
jgi:hypothetical protein